MKESFEKIVKMIKDYKPSVVVFDTLLRFHGADENDASEMNVIMQQFRQLAEMGPAVLILHQTNKGKDFRTSGRGSTEIPASVDLEFIVQEVNREKRVISIESGKTRIDRLDKILLQIVSRQTSLAVVPYDVQNDRSNAIAQIALDAGAEGIVAKDIREELAEDHGITISKAQLTRDLSKMVVDRSLLVTGENKKETKYVSSAYDLTGSLSKEQPKGSHS